MASRTVDHGTGFRPSYILDERSRTHFAAVPSGDLSIKCMVHGSAEYQVEGARIRLQGPCFLLLNHGQPYSVEIDEEEPVDSFCVFFGAGLVEDVRRAALPDARILDEPFSAHRPVRVMDRLYPFDEIVIPALMRLRHTTESDPSGVEDGLRALAESLLYAQQRLPGELDRIPAARAATREELYRRVYRARDFIESHLDKTMVLADVARAACLSPHHFHRAFREHFQETPHRYQSRRRLELARSLLIGTDQPIAEICVSVGWESLPSFITLFRSRYGVTPAQFRKNR